MASRQIVASQRTSVLCACCRGTGRDLLGIMSALAPCCVGADTRSVSTKTPYVRPAFCHGAGVVEEGS